MNQLSVIRNTSLIIAGSDFDSLIERFINSQDVKDSSRETYRKALRRFALWLSVLGTNAPVREDIIAYKRFLGDEGLSSLTLSGYIVAVRRFFEWCEGVNLYPDIAKGIKGTKRSKQFRKEPLIAEQVRELLDRVNRSTIEGKRDYALLNLMIRTGLRTNEVVMANIGDIRQQSGEALLYVHGKGRDSKDEFVILTQETLKPLYEYLQAKDRVDGSAPLFTSLSDRNNNQRLTTRSIRRIVKHHFKGIGLVSNKLTAHSLRHTFATIALLNGAPILQVKEAMRHKNIDTTTIYAHAIDRISNGAERYIKL